MKLREKITRTLFECYIWLTLQNVKFHCWKVKIAHRMQQVCLKEWRDNIKAFEERAKASSLSFHCKKRKRERKALRNFRVSGCFERNCLIFCLIKWTNFTLKGSIVLVIADYEILATLFEIMKHETFEATGKIQSHARL